PANVGGGISVVYGHRRGSFAVRGVPHDFFKVTESVPFPLGRKINPLDDEQVRKIAVIGTGVAERVFGKDVDPVGKDIRVNGVVMRVVGTFYDKGNRGRDAERVDSTISTLQKVFGSTVEIAAIWVRPL